MDDKKNIFTDSVNVTMHAMTLRDMSGSYAKVMRKTARMGNIVDKIMEQEKNLSRETILYAAGLLRNGIVELLKGGAAVEVLELGVLYIKPTRGMETDKPEVDDVPPLTLSFSPSALAVAAVQNVTVGANVTPAKEPVVQEIIDLRTNTAGTTLSAGGSVLLKGKRLRITESSVGESGTGVYFAPCDGSGGYKADMSDWVRVNPSLITENTTTRLLFTLPADLTTGTYRLVIRTSNGRGTYPAKVVRSGMLAEVVTVV